MGTDTPAAGGETKPVVKHKDRPPYHGGRNNANKNNNYNYNAREKFLGADANLRGNISKAKRTWSEQVANFKIVDDLIKAQVGTEYNPFVFEFLEQVSIAVPPEPVPVYAEKSNIYWSRRHVRGWKDSIQKQVRWISHSNWQNLDAT